MLKPRVRVRRWPNYWGMQILKLMMKVRLMKRPMVKQMMKG